MVNIERLDDSSSCAKLTTVVCMSVVNTVATVILGLVALLLMPLIAIKSILSMFSSSESGRVKARDGLIGIGIMVLLLIPVIGQIAFYNILQSSDSQQYPSSLDQLTYYTLCPYSFAKNIISYHVCNQSLSSSD